MPILDVDKARTVMVIKRSMSPGFAGIDNELYYMDRTLMLFGDAKAFVAEIVKEFRPFRYRRQSCCRWVWFTASPQNPPSASPTSLSNPAP